MSDNCIILRFYNLLGKKWTYPVLYCVQQNETYSFEDLIKLSKRRINRAILSEILKELVSIKIMCKNEEGRYLLTDRGNLLRQELIKIKFILLKDQDIECTDGCRIVKYFYDGLPPPESYDFIETKKCPNNTT